MRPMLDEFSTRAAPALETRRSLAAIAFQHTAIYDTAIAEYLRRGTPDELLPRPNSTFGLRRLLKLRYGENPHQAAALYGWGRTPAGLDDAADVAVTPPRAQSRANGTLSRQGAAIGRRCAAVAGQRTWLQQSARSRRRAETPSRASARRRRWSSSTPIPAGWPAAIRLVESYRRAHAGDPVSAYGGILGFNREVDEATARRDSASFSMRRSSRRAIAPRRWQFWRRRRICVCWPPTPPSAQQSWQDRRPRSLSARCAAGQRRPADPDSGYDFRATICPRKVVSEREPTLDGVTDLLFAWKAVQQVKSNAIVLAKKLTVVGVGAGQMNRVYSVQIAVDRAGDRARGSVLASDAYFPFADGVETAAKAGVTAIIQPGGSIRDSEAIKAANKSGIAMIVTGQRHFRH